MFQQLRREDRRLDGAVVAELLNKCQYGVLSTVGLDGYPYGVPMNYVFYKNAIYFHGAMEGHKHQNLLASPQASFCAVAHAETIPEKFTTCYESVIAFGKLEEVEGVEKEEALIVFVKKYAGEYLEEGIKRVHNAGHRCRVLKMSVVHVAGKAK